MFAATILCAETPYHIYFVEDNSGVPPLKPATIAAMSVVFSLFGAYITVGYYQMFFIELRQKFIACEVTREGNIYRLRGYYFKKAEFSPSDLARVEEHHLDRRFGRTIVTMLAWAPQTPTPNYKITLKDDRVFYLPGTLEEVEQLKEQLQADIESNLSSSPAG